MQNYWHSVVIQFKPGVNAEEFFQALILLCKELKETKNMEFISFDYGKHDNSEIISEYTYIFRMVFPNETQFLHYLNHPKHEKFAQHAMREFIQSLKPVNGYITSLVI